MITYHIASSGPLPKVLHFFNNVVTSHIGEHWEPVHIGTRLGDRRRHTLTTEWHLWQSTVSIFQSLTSVCTLQRNTAGVWTHVAAECVCRSAPVGTHSFDQLVFHDASVVLMNVALLPVLKQTNTEHVHKLSSCSFTYHAAWKFILYTVLPLLLLVNLLLMIQQPLLQSQLWLKWCSRAGMYKRRVIK